MKTAAVLVAVVALATATATATNAATTCNGACPENLKPLCGSDGVTYDNECMLEFARCTAVNAGKTPITLASNGRCGATTTPTPTPTSGCAKDFACLQVIDPVCGSDGKTYNSACELKQVQCAAKPTLTVKSRGECPSAGSSGSAGSKANGNGTACAITVCTKEYKAHCGSDGKTYTNKCEFTNAQCKASTTATKLTLKAEAACDSATSRGGGSVGGDAGAGASNVSAGSSVGCVTACTKEFAPVCGSNAVTYDNVCLFKNAQCANATLKQTASTACPTTPPKNSASVRVATACAVVLSAVVSLAL